jgi:hypothetical protein
MQKRFIVAIAMGFGTFMVSSFAAQPKLPDAVATDLRAFAAECIEVGGKALTDKAIVTADLNGDGKQDYVLDVGSIQCDGAASIYGDRDKMVNVYVGDGANGAVKAFSDMSYGVRVENAGANTKLWLTLMGERCGKKPARDFASEHFCDRALAWNPAKKKFDFAPISTVKMLE